ncbi:MOSC domain-containing protein [Syntrophomonas erecta]
MAETTGTVLAVNVSRKTGEKKYNVGKAFLDVNLGIGMDAHSGPWHRQISLLSWSSFEKMRALGADVDYGGFAENLTVDGVEVSTLPVGTRISTGEAVLEITQIGKSCHNKACAIKQKTGTCVMPREGVFARVITPGWVKVGDCISLVK